MNHDDQTRTLYALARTWARALAANNCQMVNAMAERARHPEVGDIVAEWSHIRRFDHIDKMEESMGRLKSVTVEDGDTIYTIAAFDGQSHRWSNATFIVLVPRFGAWPVLDADPVTQPDV